MAYYSKYSGKEVDERLDRVDSIPTKISQLLNDKDYITEIELKAILDKIPIVDFSKIPIDEDTIYWSENSDGKLVLKSKGGGEDSNWSVKKDSNGNKYIYTELPVVTQYGVTMYGNSGDINLPSLYAGLPIDNQTIYWDNGVLKSLGGGGEGLDEEALRNYLLINGYATESWVLNLGYIGPEGLKNYVDISSNQDINGKKNFKSGISINGLDIYQSQDDVIYLDANLVVRGGITMFSDGEDVDIPSIAQGLPFDNRTIWYNPNTNQIEVIGGTGGGSGEGVSNFWDLSGIPSWITNSKPKYTYSEIEGTPDLSGFATQNWIISQGYALAEELKKYIPISGYTEVSGEKNFTGGLKVNGSPIYYDTEKKYWKLEGDLLVTGGVTMYGSDSSFTPSTIMDAINVDGTTISKEGGVLKVIGGTGGGVADSVAWANITGKPTFATVATSGKYSDLSGTPSSLPASDVYSWAKASTKPSYSYSEITGAISTTELQNYLTQNSYLNVTSGDNRYLKLSGGEISGTGLMPLTINTSNSGIEILLKCKSNTKVHVGWSMSDGVFLQEGESEAYIGVQTNKIPYYFNGTRYTLWHEGNFTPSNYLPLSGGTIYKESESYPITLLSNTEVTGMKFTTSEAGAWIFYGGGTNWRVTNNGFANSFNIWHSGNDGSGSGLDADLLDGVHLMGKGGTHGIMRSWARGTYTTSKQYFGNGNVVVIDPKPTDDSSLWANTTIFSVGDVEIRSHQLAFGYDEDRILYRRVDDGPRYNSWRTIAFTDSNVASATKLQTARTIWGQSFDGTSNVSGVISGVDGISFNSYNAVSVDYNSNFVFKQPNTTTLQDWSIQKQDTTKIFMVRNDGNVGIGTASPAYKLDVNGEFRCVSAIHIQPHIEGWADAFFNYSSTKGYLLSARGGEANKNFRLYNYTDSSYNALIDVTEYGNVGIGTTNPIAKLDVSGGISCDAVLCQWNNSTSFNVANMLNPGYAWYGSTKSHLYPNNGTQATMCWKSVLSNGYETAYSIGTFHPTNSYGYMILTVGHGTTRDCFLEIQASGVVSVSGNFLAQGGITMYSDQRKKTILNHVELSLKQIAEAPLIEHYYNSDDKKTTHVGSIAQYWASMNDWFCKLDSEGYYTMEIQNAALASAISIARELDRYENKTDKAIKKLKKRICELEEEVKLLKAS